MQTNEATPEMAPKAAPAQALDEPVALAGEGLETHWDAFLRECAEGRMVIHPEGPGFLPRALVLTETSQRTLLRCFLEWFMEEAGTPIHYTPPAKKAQETE